MTNLLTVRNKVLPKTIIEAIKAIENVTLRELDNQDREIFANASDEARCGEYTEFLEESESYLVMVLADTDRITFITCDEDGIDVMKEFVITAL